MMKLVEALENDGHTWFKYFANALNVSRMKKINDTTYAIKVDDLELAVKLYVKDKHKSYAVFCGDEKICAGYFSEGDDMKNNARNEAKVTERYLLNYSDEKIR